MYIYDVPKSIYILFFINNLLKQIECMNYIKCNNLYEWFMLTVDCRV